MATTEFTGIPESIEWNREWSGPKGVVHYFNITFEDGTEGQFSTTKKDQTKFVIGKETKYELEVKSNNRGDYNFITIPKDANAGRGGGAGGRRNDADYSPEIQRSILASVCLDCASIIILKSGMSEQVKPDLVALHVLSNKLYKHIMEKSANDKQTRINYQSRLKQVVDYLIEFKGLAITNSDEVLKYVDMEVVYIQSKMKE